RGDDEHHLPSRLAEQIHRVRIAEDRAQEHGQQQQVAGDADGPRPDLAAHAAQGAEQSEDVAEHLAEEDELSAREFDPRVEEPLQEIHVGPFPVGCSGSGEKGSGMLIAARTRCDGMQDVRLSSRLYCRCRSSTGSTAERVADYHRRLGLPPTPEHVTGRDRVILAGSRTPSRRARDSRMPSVTAEPARQRSQWALWAAASSRRARISSVASWAREIAEPATKTFAPASAQRSMVSRLTPPSTWMDTSRFDSLIAERARRILGSIDSRKL